MKVSSVLLKTVLMAPAVIAVTTPGRIIAAEGFQPKIQPSIEREASVGDLKQLGVSNMQPKFIAQSTAPTYVTIEYPGTTLQVPVLKKGVSDNSGQGRSAKALADALLKQYAKTNGYRGCYDNFEGLVKFFQHKQAPQDTAYGLTPDGILGRDSWSNLLATREGLESPKKMRLALINSVSSQGNNFTVRLSGKGLTWALTVTKKDGQLIIGNPDPAASLGLFSGILNGDNGAFVTTKEAKQKLTDYVNPKQLGDVIQKFNDWAKKK